MKLPIILFGKGLMKRVIVSIGPLVRTRQHLKHVTKIALWLIRLPASTYDLNYVKELFAERIIKT